MSCSENDGPWTCDIHVQRISRLFGSRAMATAKVEVEQRESVRTVVFSGRLKRVSKFINFVSPRLRAFH